MKKLLTVFAIVCAAILIVSCEDINAGSVEVSWTPPTSYDDGTPLNLPFSVEVFYGPTSGSLASAKVVPAPANSTRILGLTLGTRYFFSARTIDQFGNSSNMAAEVNTVCTKGTPQGVMLRLK
jgi:hypothetical protein